MLRLAHIHTILEALDKDNNRIPFNIEFVASTGELITAENIVFLSSQKLHNTIRCKWPNGQIRSIHKPGIIKINEHEIVY